MQKIDTSHSKKKIIVAATALLIVIIFAGGIAAYYMTRESDKRGESAISPSNTVDYEKPTEEQKQAGVDAKKDFIDRTEKEENSTGQQSGVSSASFSSINQEGATLRVRTVISSSTEGVCTLTLERSGQSKVVQEAATQDMGSYTTCKGFDIDTTSMAKGTWKISLFYSRDAAGVLAISTTEIR